MSEVPVKQVNIGPTTPAPSPEAQTAPVVDETPVENTEVPVEETGAQKPVQESQEDVNIAARFAALARQEERTRKERQEIKEAREKLDEYNKLRESISENPMAALDHLGIDLDSLIMASLGDAAPQEEIDPVSKLQSDFESYKEQVQREKEEAVAAQESAQQEAIDRAVEAHKRSIEAELKDNDGKYELIHLNEAHDLVWEVTEAHYNEYGEVLEPSRAADLVEAHLDEKFQKIAKARKLNTPLEETAAQPEQKKIISSKTLTSSMSTNTPQVAVSNKPLTAEESKRRAAAMLKWNN